MANNNQSLIFKMTLSVLIILAMAGCIQTASAERKYTENQKYSSVQYHKLNILGEKHRNGIYDISVEYGNDGIGWLAYSRVILPKFVETRLAKSSDKGKTWKYVTTVNRSKMGSLKKVNELISGVWRYETPTLLYDPRDVPACRWKLFYQRVFSKPPYKKGAVLWGESWIEYRYAAAPDESWSQPIRLLSGQDGKAQVNLNRLHPDLRGMSFYNEIGSIIVNGNIYLSLDASPTPSGLGKWRKRKVILISSTDHAKSWRYVGTLTDYDDASDFGYLSLTESSLAQEGDKIFLLITPSGKKGLFNKKGHDGTLVIEFEDIQRAKLQRDTKGKLVVIKQFKPVLYSGGASSYDEQNSNGGIFFCQIDVSVKSRDAELFKVFTTGEKITK